MKRLSFIVLASAAAVAVPLRGRTAFAVERVRSVVRLGRADRSILVGTAGGCASRRHANPLGRASRRRANPLAGYVPGDFF